MLSRPAEDVWAELDERCRRHQMTRTAINTLRRETPNRITAVEAAQIHRRSAQARSEGGEAGASFSDITRLWGELRRSGRTSGTSTLRFSFALLGRLIEGISFAPDLSALIVSDEVAANRTWQSVLASGADVVAARADLMAAIEGLRVYRDGELRAPHKPLVLMFALARYANGTASRWLEFRTAEHELGRLLRTLSSLSDEAEPQEPFWRLKSSGVWQVEADGDLDLRPSDPPPVGILRERHVRGGFTDDIHGALWNDAALVDAAIRALLDKHIPADQHARVLEGIGISTSEPAPPSPSPPPAAASGELHLLLRWQPAQNPNTITDHRKVAEASGSVWWGKIGDPKRSAIAAERIKTIAAQLTEGKRTHVYLYRPGELWQTDLLALETDRNKIDSSLVPTYYDPALTHHLWLRLANFVPIPPAFAASRLVLASTGQPPNFAGQSSLFLVNETSTAGQSAAIKDRCFIFNTSTDHFQEKYGDFLGERLGFDSDVTGRVPLLEAASGRFVYYQTSKGKPAHPSSFIGVGTITDVKAVVPTGSNDKQRWTAELANYQPLAKPVARVDYSPPGWNHQHGIAEITHEQFTQILERGSVRTEPPVAIVDFTAAELKNSAVKAGLLIEDQVYQALLGALRSGKHVILTGPPGTAKTTLAELTATLARSAGLCDGYALTTATADWTTYETIGGLSPAKSGHGLVFRPGHFLEAAAANKWLLIDELNRSNFDRAFGQLFTVLSGQSVVLPYQDEASGKPIALVAEGVTNYSPDEYSLLSIPGDWRIVATMNVFDKSLLFEMSFALMRRFAFIEVSAPSDNTYQRLWTPLLKDLHPEAKTQVDKVLLGLLRLRHLKEIGPAVFLDMARFANEVGAANFNGPSLAYQLFYSYLLPQFEGIDRKEGEQLFALVSRLVAPGQRARLRSTLNSVLGLSLPSATSNLGGAPEVDPDGITVDPDGTTVDPDGTTADPDGTAVDPNGATADPGGSKVDVLDIDEG